ncbi:MAG: C40 family peptidase [Desulfovibrio sp.]|nr:C40 family peptidase [Desulfovibrio sp.]
MGKGLKLGALLLGTALVFGCAKTPEETAAPQPVNEEQEQAPETKEQTVKAPETVKFRAKASRTVARNDSRTGKKLVKKAKTALGTPYVFGGSKPGGFDCSGLVKWTYNSVGVDLPRTAREQSTVGLKINNIEDMREGDIVAFRHPKRGYHTGIYIGDGKFVHSPRKRSFVRINSLDEPYFNSTLLGARRVVPGETSNVVADAESRLEKFLSQRGELRVTPKNEAAVSSWAGVGAKKVASKTATTVKKGKARVAKGKTAKTSEKNAKVAAKNSKSPVANKKAKSGKAAVAVKASKSGKPVAANNAKNSKSAATKTVAKNSKHTAAKKTAAKTVAQKQTPVKAAQNGKNAKSAKAAVASQQSKKKVAQSRRS